MEIFKNERIEIVSWLGRLTWLFNYDRYETLSIPRLVSFYSFTRLVESNWKTRLQQRKDIDKRTSYRNYPGAARKYRCNRILEDRKISRRLCAPFFFPLSYEISRGQYKVDSPLFSFVYVSPKSLFRTTMDREPCKLCVIRIPRMFFACLKNNLAQLHFRICQFLISSIHPLKGNTPDHPLKGNVRFNIQNH